MPVLENTVSILVCEDHEQMLSLITEALSVNYPQLAFFSASNGVAGLQCFRKHLPDIVITDYSMPFMNGIQMAREMQSIKDIKLIFISAYSEKTIFGSSALIRIDHYLLKPLDLKKLFNAVDDCLTDILKKRVVIEGC